MSRRAWLTSDVPPTGEYICRLLRIPNNVYFIANVNGALLSLCEEWNWEQFGAMTVAETVAAMIIMYGEYSQGTVCLIGSLQLYATGTQPDNTLPCDGTTYLRTDYQRLYDTLDAQYIVDADSFFTPNPPSFSGLNWFIVAK